MAPFFGTAPTSEDPHSLNKLRPFHLGREAALSMDRARDVDSERGLSRRVKKSIANISMRANGVLSTPYSFVLSLAIVLSLVFIAAISCSWRGAQVDRLPYRQTLDDAAIHSPGVMLFGESIDVDVDEPSITIRWSIMVCGDNALILDGSSGIHGSTRCGFPSDPLHLFVDSEVSLVMVYDPALIPFNRNTGDRRIIQDLVQFETDHVLDVQKAFLYPFDAYFLSSTFSAKSPANESIPVRRIFTNDIALAFNIESSDMDSFRNTADGSRESTRAIDMHVRRPTEAKIITLVLFSLSWMLTHVTVGQVILCRRTEEIKPILVHLLSAGVILFIHPQLRNSMPDAPGFDGFLIDSIGFFPQMIITGLCVVNLLLIAISRELRQREEGAVIHSPSLSDALHPFRPPRKKFLPATPTSRSDSLQISLYEAHKLMRQLRGQYVFPPVNEDVLHRRGSQNKSDANHRKAATLLAQPAKHFGRSAV